MKTAHGITRTGLAIAKREHLLAANQPRACLHCTNVCDEGKLCPLSADTAMGTLRVFGRAFGPYLVAVLVSLLLAAAPVYLDDAATATTSEARP